jgi:hypothetical protein
VSDTGKKCPTCRKGIKHFYLVKDSDIKEAAEKKGGKRTRKLGCKFKCGRRTKHKYNKAKRRKLKKTFKINI